MLCAIAQEMRPPKKSGFIPLIPLAKQLNVRVWLQLSNASRRSHALSDLSSNPIDVTIIRHGSVRGRQIVESDDEATLRPSERFSLAHELGHVLAFQRFGVQPEKEKSAYWAQEACMNEFSQRLLVPDWLLKRWLNAIEDVRPVPLHALRTWGIEECGISQQVVATAISKACHGVAFMTAQIHESKSLKSQVLKVLFSTRGGDIRLPATHSHLSCPQLRQILLSKPFGVADIDEVRLDRRPQALKLAWRQTQNTSQAPVYWLSLAKKEESRYWEYD